MKGNDDMTRHARKQRELLLLRYTDAITRGDLDAIGPILDQATNDPELERGIWETHMAIGEELRQEEMKTISEQLERHATQVTNLASTHFSSPVSRSPDELAPPQAHAVTVGELVAALRSSKEIVSEIKERLRFLERSEDICDSDLSVRGVRTLLARIGLASANKRLVEKVQELLFTLGMQRQSPDVRLAAARRQKSLRGLDVTSAPEPISKDSTTPEKEETS